MTMRRFHLAPLAILCSLSPLGYAAEKPSTESADKSIERIKVIGTNPHRYQTSSGNSLFGQELDYLEMPRVIDVLPEQLLLDQKVTELEDALRNVPGVSLSDGFGGSNNDYLIRGFRRNTIYSDGLRIASDFRVNTSNLESIRVIKGPASITYGQVEPGGLVDVITKKPLDERRLYTEVRAGSWDNYMFQGDFSTPIGDKAAVRANVSLQDSGYFRDNFDIKRNVVSLTGRYDLSSDTRLTASYEYRDEFRTFDRGTMTAPTANGREIVNRLLDIPLSRRFGDEAEEIDTRFEFVTVGLNHMFANGWQIDLLAAWENAYSNDLQSRPAAAVITDASAPIVDGFITAPDFADHVKAFYEDGDRIFLARRTDGNREYQRHADYQQLRVTGDWQFAGMNHRLAFGADRRSYDDARYFIATPITQGTAATGALFDIANPIYDMLPTELSTEGAERIKAATDDYGFFANDYVELTEQLSVLFGGRWDFSDVDGDGPAKTVNEFSPQVALNYRVLDNLSAFVSYSEAFSPNTTFKLEPNGQSSDTELFPPENSKQYEVGAKGQFFEGKLNSSLALYKIEKENVLTQVDNEFQLVKGQQSQGVELNINGQPLPGWTVMAGYAYTDAEISSGENAGNRPRNVAEHTASLWTSYEFHEGTWQGVGAGIGAFYMGDRFGDDINSWNLGSYTTVDLSLWYTLPTVYDGNIRLQLSAKNLFDEEYYSASGGDLRVSIGSPRSLFASISATF
ncbi:TonB-dependent siderophore receptor [Shewanella sp. A3A]|nr:TonB-dependent siderophore receptor [Shewanella ferrihydritica]